MDSDQGLDLDKAILGDLPSSFGLSKLSAAFLLQIITLLDSFIPPLLLGIPLFPQH